MGSVKGKIRAIDEYTLEQLPVAVALFDNKKIYYLNKKARKLFKIKRQDEKKLESISIFDQLKPEFHKRVKTNNTKILKGETFDSVELEFLDFTGNPILLEAITSPVYYNGKKVLESTFTEITERKKNEDELKQIKHKFELITNNSNDIICFYSYFPDEKYIYVSPNIKKILGYTPTDLLKNKNFFNERLVGNKNEFQNVVAVIRELQKKNKIESRTFTFKTTKKNGEEIWLENNLVPITNDKRKIIFFLNVLRNVTDQKEKEIEIKAQSENYQNLLDNSQVAYVIHHQGIITYCNNQMIKLLKYKSKKSMLGKFAIDFFIKSDRKRVVDRIKELYGKKNQGIPNYYRLKDSSGKALEVEINSNIIRYNNTECILSSVINLTEQRQKEREAMKTELMEQSNRALQSEIEQRTLTEERLRTKTKRLTSILENTNHLIWSINTNYCLLSFNGNFANTVKEKYNINLQEGLRIGDQIFPEEKRKEYELFWYPKYERVFNGESIEFEREDIIPNKPVKYRKIFINPIYNEKREVVEASCIAHDITEAKKYEQQLQKQSAKLNSVFESSHHYIWTIDSQRCLTSFNRNYYDLVSSLYDTKPYIGLVLNRGVLSNDKKYNELLSSQYERAFKGESANFEIETLDKNKDAIYLDIFLNPIFENGKVIEVSGIAHDITERKIGQQKIEQSLKEKEVLLKEVHHRVKNNMQVISSILNLQSSYVTDENSLLVLKESQNRIKTMAYIHESLYQNKSFTSVNFSEYINTLANNIVHSYSEISQKIKVTLHLERINLNLDSSIPAGLIVNELVTNSIKHAFAGRSEGEIIISLKSENNNVYLEVKDDGRGFDPSVDFNNTQTLGLQLVNTLADQLNARVTFTTEINKGSTIGISFKM